MSSALSQKIKRDIDFRRRLFLLLSFVFNFAYAIFLFTISLLFSSKWFFIMAIYYGFLSTARIFIFSQIKKEPTIHEKIWIMRACGYFLFLLNIVVSVIIFLLIYTSTPVRHHEITVITLATYTFSTLTVAIINSVKHLKKNDYVYSCVKIISLISASVSMLTLTNTMLTTFGEDNAPLRKIILPIFSGVISIFIIACAILMIKKTNLALRILKDEKERK